MKDDVLTFPLKILRFILLATALWYPAIYLFMAFHRIQYPFSIEWVEDACANTVLRILSGQKMYVSPSAEFIPPIYPPLYFYLSALVAKFTGPGFFPLRLVSFLASLGSFSIIYLFVKKETQSRFFGILSFCLFAATFKITDAWFDIGRPDSLVLFLALASLYFIRFKPDVRGCVWAALLLSLSVLTKQIALALVLPITIYLMLVDKRRALFFIGTLVPTLGIGVWLINTIHDGWFWYYTFSWLMPSQHSIQQDLIINFWTQDLLRSLPVACTIASLYFFFPPTNRFGKNHLFYLLATIGMLAGSWAARLQLGGVLNGLFFAYAILAILFGLSLSTLFKKETSSSIIHWPYIKIILLMASFIQFNLLAYNFFHYIPTKEQIKAGQIFIEDLKNIKGDLFLFHNEYLAILSGKKSNASLCAIWYIGNSDKGPIKEKLMKEIKQNFREKKFAAIVLASIDYNSQVGKWFRDEIQQNYVIKKEVVGYKTLLQQRPRWLRSPEWILVPKNTE